jgi:hypothetical protein
MCIVDETNKTIKLTLPAIYYNAIIHHEYIGLTVPQIKELNHLLIINGVYNAKCETEFVPYFNDNSDLLIDYIFTIEI